MNNVDFIQKWFLDNNQYLQNNINKNEILDILTMNVIAFEKLDGIDNHDKIYFNVDSIQFTSGEICYNEKVNNILKIVNNVYGYLSIDNLKEIDVYSLLVDNLVYKELSDDDIITYFSDVFEILKRNYKDYDFEKVVYKIDDNVFFSKDILNDKEIEEIMNIKDDNQNLFEIIRENDGRLRVY